jgi:anti-sigma B factor antagonist
MPQAPLHPDSVAELEEAVPLLFECTLTSPGSGAGWLHVAGELDMATAPRIEQALRQAERHARLVVLDLRGLTFMDCSGIHVIVDASLRARSGGHRLVLVRGPSQVDRVFALAGVLGVVDIVGLDTAEDAIQTHLGTAREGRVAVTSRLTRVAAFMSAHEASPCVEGALIAQGVGSDGRSPL